MALRVHLPATPEGSWRQLAADRGLTGICRRGRGRQICDAALYHIVFDGIEGLHLYHSRVSAMYVIDYRYIPYSRVKSNIAFRFSGLASSSMIAASMTKPGLPLV